MARKGCSLSPLHLIAALSILIPAVRSSDADALLAFKSAITGADAVLQNWSPGSSPCGSRWTGVICVNRTVVYGIRLEGAGLSGPLRLDALEALPGLRTVSFMNNQFEGAMPQLGKLRALKSIYLSRNRFSGPIDDGAFTGMRKLKKVFLSENGFTGTVPTSLAALPRLLVLRLDHNGFNGPIPELRQAGLKLVNVSYNNLDGPIPDRLKNMNANLFVGNKGLCGAPVNVACKPTTEVPPPAPPPAVSSIPKSSSSSSPSSSKMKFSIPVLIVAIVIAVGVLLAILGVIAAVRRRRNKHDRLGRPPSQPKKLEPSDDAEKMEHGSSDYNGVGAVAVAGAKRATREAEHGRLAFVREDRERFELQDLLKASAEVLGSGNFGSSYKAVLQQGPAVVVKRFREMNGVGREDFQEHMRRLGRLSHPNLLPLVAYYYRKEEKLLVTDYIVYGSLAHMLHGTRASNLPLLDWPARLKIVKGVTRGLAYLYDELPMLSLPHGHLKSSNVLLNESFEPLLTDYSLIPVMNQSHASQVMVAYKSPEVTQSGRTSKKSDVWSLGILILEILTGKFPANYLQQGKGSTDFGGWVNSVVKEEWTGDVFDSEMKHAKTCEGEMLKLLQIGLSCCQEDSEKRWDMSEALEKIEELKEEEGGDESSSSVSEGSKDVLPATK